MKTLLFRDDAVNRLSLMAPQSVDMVLTDVPVAIDVRERPSVWHFPNPAWLSHALRVSRGPVVYTLAPDSFLKWIAHLREYDFLAPDQLMVWMIERAEHYQAGQKSVGADYNLICVHRPGRKAVAQSDVILARPGLVGAATCDWTDNVKLHPAPGSYDLAYRLTTIWGAKSVLDPFCGVGVTLEGARAAGAEELIGIDIDADYLAVAREHFKRFGELFEKDEFPNVSLTVGRGGP